MELVTNVVSKFNFVSYFSLEEPSLPGYKKSGKKQYGQRQKQTKLPGLGVLTKPKPPIKPPAIAAPIPTKMPAGYDPKKSIEDQDVTVKAKLIRELLK